MKTNEKIILYSGDTKGGKKTCWFIYFLFQVKIQAYNILQPNLYPSPTCAKAQGQTTVLSLQNNLETLSINFITTDNSTHKFFLLKVTKSTKSSTILVHEKHTREMPERKIYPKHKPSSDMAKSQKKCRNETTLKQQLQLHHSEL